jgi:hypothetical protein
MKPSEETWVTCCWNCGAEVTPGRLKCWLCGEDLSDEPVDAQPVQETPPIAPDAPFQYGISSLLLFITLAAILCSLFTMHPGLGIVATIFAVPALLRTAVVASNRGHAGKPMTTGAKASSFALTFAVVFTVCVLIIGAFVAAFFATCMVTANMIHNDSYGLDSLVISLIVGGIAAISTAVLCGYTIRKQMRRKRNR